MILPLVVFGNVAYFHNFEGEFDELMPLIGSTLTLFGMFLFRRFMAERSIAYVIVFLTLVGTVLYLPIVGMYYGLHEWTAAVTGGVVDARFIAVVDTALESPLGQISDHGATRIAAHRMRRSLRSRRTTSKPEPSRPF